MEPEPSSSTRSSKRPRTDASGPPRVKSSELWLEDGNFIVETTSQEARTLYKVHRSTLALNTIFFRTLFSGSQEAFIAGSEQYEGLPLMTMTDDADDVKHFLYALYFPEFLQQHLPSPNVRKKLYHIPSSYAGVLRIATKLECDTIRDSVIRILKLAWPSLLGNWDQREDAYRVLENEFYNKQEVVDESTSCNIRADPADLIRLATDCNVPDLLPAAYYDLACIYGRQPSDDEPFSFRSTNLSNMDAACLIRLVEGKGRLAEAFTEIISNLVGCFDDRKKGCDRRTEDDPWPCGPTLQVCIRKIWPTDVDDLTELHKPLEYLRGKGKDSFRGRDGEICSSCRSWAKNVFWEYREYLCMSLPENFCLDDLLGLRWGLP